MQLLPYSDLWYLANPLQGSAVTVYMCDGKVVVVVEATAAAASSSSVTDF